jgi:hypothetical protein
VSRSASVTKSSAEVTTGSCGLESTEHESIFLGGTVGNKKDKERCEKSLQGFDVVNAKVSNFPSF